VGWHDASLLELLFFRSFQLALYSLCIRGITDRENAASLHAAQKHLSLSLSSSSSFSQILHLSIIGNYIKLLWRKRYPFGLEVRVNIGEV
jgi:hypothetical protein